MPASIIVTARPPRPRHPKPAGERPLVPAIVTARKPRAKPWATARTAPPAPADPQAEAEVAAFFARMVRPA